MTPKFYFFLLLFISTISCKKNSGNPFNITSIDPMKDGPGTTVTIKGNGFGNNTSSVTVMFNGTNATLISVSDTVIVVTVPHGATTGKIQITVNGNSVVSNDEFVILSGEWIRKADLPADPRGEAVAFSIGDKGYIATGFNGGAGMNDLYEYDPAMDTWTQKASLPSQGRYRATVMTIKDKAYIVCGAAQNGGDLKEVWEYDPATDTWTRKNDFPGESRSDATGFVIGNKGYFGTGSTYIPVEYLKDWWEYDPVIDTWTQKTDFSGGVGDWSMATAIDNKGYLGLSSYSQSENSNDWWQYDPTLDTWTRKADFPGSQTLLPVCFIIDNKVCMVIGTGECWEYDPLDDTWNQKTSHPTYREGGVAFSINDKGYVGTGSSKFAPYGYLSTDFWEFAPE